MNEEKFVKPAENIPVQGEQGEKEERLGVEVIKEKILASWGTARDQFGVPNNHRLAEVLYKSIYHPEEIEHEEIFGRPEFNRKATLSVKIELGENLVPDEKEFILAIRRAMTSETRFDKCLYPGALEFLDEISQYGPETIWTRGDVYGFPEKGYYGSHEQFKRIAIAGVGDLRKELAKKSGVERGDIIAVSASENKIKLLEGIIQKYKEKGIKKVIVFDDQLKNLIDFLNTCKDHIDIEFIPVWVRQGNYKNNLPKNSEKNIDDWKTEFNAVDRIENAVNSLQQKGILTKNDRGVTGFIIDFDDVLSEDAKRQNEQVKSVLEMMQRKGWIKKTND